MNLARDAILALVVAPMVILAFAAMISTARENDAISRSEKQAGIDASCVVFRKRVDRLDLEGAKGNDLVFEANGETFLRVRDPIRNKLSGTVWWRECGTSVFNRKTEIMSIEVSEDGKR